MPTRVLVGSREPREGSLTRATAVSFAQSYGPGETFDPNSRRQADGQPIWWRNHFLATGESGWAYYCRSGEFMRSGEQYKRGRMVIIPPSLGQLALTYESKVIGPTLPEITVGEVWRPIAEKVTSLLVRAPNLIETVPEGAPMPDVPYADDFDRLDEVFSITLGTTPWRFVADLFPK